MHIKLSKISLVVVSTVLLSGCMSQLDALSRVGKAPDMDRMEVPMANPDYEPVEWPYEYDADYEPEIQEQAMPMVKKRYAGSLWQRGSQSFFKGKKARRVGDILKVTVRVKDKAELDNQTQRVRTSTGETLPSVALGLEQVSGGLLTSKFKPFSGINLNSSTNSTGDGTIEREEVIETEVAAMVTQILPNGNLVVHADQEIRVNFELRKITVQGIVRPEDIGADNSINANQIAQARISYGGKGQLTDAQQPRIGHQILDAISPF
jgi:flagellar L-ring protein precursor FlgH